MQEQHGKRISMDMTLLIESFLGLVVILALLIFFMMATAKKKKIAKLKEVKEVVARKGDVASIESLVAVIKEKTSTAKELEDATSLILKHYGTIHPKLGVRLHPDFNIYGEALIRISKHPNASKKIMLAFEKGLEQKNPEYKREINDFFFKGINSRGA